jgi:mycofactocin precursor
MEQHPMVADPAADDVLDEAGTIDARSLEDALIEDELLVEEISIDGMCGVY